jgi:CRP/FNR family transcriptional regulator, cyclic AMP receptor protein
MRVVAPSRAPARAQICCSRDLSRSHVLLEDTDLYESLPSATRDRAVEDCVAEIVSLPQGSWPGADRDPRLCEVGFGLLLLDGLVLCRRGIDGRFGAELLGAGDLLRPCQETDAPALTLSTTRRVLTPTRLAVLDLSFARSVARYPELGEELLARAISRSRNLSVLMAIAHQPRIEVRLRALFWHLAGRWGRIRADGVLVPLRLTHSVLADLVGARRPTVSSALAELARKRLLSSTERGWLLEGPPPPELCQLRDGSPTRSAAAVA